MAIFIIGFVIFLIITIFKGCASIDGTQMHQLQTFVCLAGTFLCLSALLLYGQLNDIAKLLKKFIEKSEDKEIKKDKTEVEHKFTENELAKLKQFVGEVKHTGKYVFNVVNFASVTDTEWICICGTHNPLDKTKEIQNCSKCNRNRDHVLENYTKEKFNLKIGK